MLKGSRVILLKSGAKMKGGLEKYAARIASAFSSCGAQVTCLSTGEVPPPANNIRFHSFPITSALSFRKLDQFDRMVQDWLQNNPADLIFGLDRNRTQTHLRAGNGVHAAFLKSRILSEGKIKYYSSLINPLHRKILSLEIQAFCNPRLQKIFANSDMVRKEITQYYPVDAAKIQVIHNGVEWGEREPDFICWKQKKEQILKKHRLDPHLLHLIFIGHGYLRKGLDILIEALRIWTFRDFHLSVIGNEKRLDQYAAKVKKWNMQNQIRFFGPQDPTPFYQLADALVIPSFYDPFANVTVEALSMGVFVVSSKTNGGHEVLTKKNGAIIENLLDKESLLEALNQALQNKKTERTAASIRQSVRRLDFSHQLQQMIDACE